MPVEKTKRLTSQSGMGDLGHKGIGTGQFLRLMRQSHYTVHEEFFKQKKCKVYSPNQQVVATESKTNLNSQQKNKNYKSLSEDEL